jgi:hypothetical protein
MSSASPRPVYNDPESIHFPWAKVEDFRHFFGLDHLIASSAHKRKAIVTCITRLLFIYSPKETLRRSIAALAARAIVLGHYFETLIEVQGELPWFEHLEHAVEIDYHELAVHQRLATLAEYLYENEIIDSFNVEGEMHLNRLTGLMVFHAADFWEDAHGELFALTNRLDNPIQIRYLSSKLLRSLPRYVIRDEQAQHFTDLFMRWPTELEQSMNEAQRLLKGTSASNPKRMNLQKIQSRICSPSEHRQLTPA